MIYNFDQLRDKAAWVRDETLLLHKRCPETRVASSLSCVELLTTLFYGSFLKFDATNPLWPQRDRFIISKGHGSISFYPILADLGFLEREALLKISQKGALLKAIPDAAIPGYETMNGSLGLGIGVGCGMAVALKKSGSKARVVVLVGDGELYEGACWEAIMFAGHHGLNNLHLVVDNNGGSMLDFTKNIMDLSPLGSKFEAFRWQCKRVEDGHDIQSLYDAFYCMNQPSAAPTAYVVETVKGKGVPSLEGDPLSHIRCVSPEEIDDLLRGRHG